ncbi:MAG TPA: helix-turn-helix domain-containing protein [Bryobacteraceae bacterium]|nr:helix-turn-helix domain-containing protein [Bryobacteraceae bacterium]
MTAATVHQAPGTESAEIRELYRLFLLQKHPALLGPNGESIPLPESIYNILVQVLGYLKQGKSVSVLPVMQELTTQQAANLLGMSRPFLIDLLNNGDIPFHKIGSHRRIYRKDVMDYLAKRDDKRKHILTEIAKRALAEGEYDQLHVPDEGE